jgi:hypothetical protein
MKPITLLFVFAAFALGVGVGGWCGHLSAIKSSVSDTPLLTSTLAAHTGLDVAYLYRLRDGKTDEVRSLLESQIDSGVVMLSERLVALPAAERDPQQLKVIQMHRDYSTKFPHTNSVPYIQAGITQAYGLLDGVQKERP